MEAEQKLLGLLVFVANFTCLIMKEHCKINTLYTEVYKMTQQTKLTTAVGEQALGTIAVLAATYAPMSTDKRLMVGVTGVILTFHGAIRANKISCEIFDEQMEQKRKMMNDYMKFRTMGWRA